MSEGLTALRAAADTMKTGCKQPPRLTPADDGQWMEADLSYGHCARSGINAAGARHGS